ncbi:hypothetical protein [Bacillus gaemokensis]
MKCYNDHAKKGRFIYQHVKKSLPSPGLYIQNHSRTDEI